MIITAREDSMRVGKVFLNGKDITSDTPEACVPRTPGKTRLGWAVVYLRDAFNHIRIEKIDGDPAPMKRRRFGFIRWEAV